MGRPLSRHYHQHRRQALPHFTRGRQALHDVAAWELPILEQAVRLHHRLVWIHLFENGNGRHARLASDLFLAFHNHPLPKWPTDIAATGSKRVRYIEALKAADRGDIDPLLQYVAELAK